MTNGSGTRCGALTRRRTSCRAKAMRNGRCRNHGGCSTGPRTADGLRRMIEAKRTWWAARVRGSIIRPHDARAYGRAN